MPAVSRTLSLLEKRLSEPLFLKGRRPLRPTPLGRALADHGWAIFVASRNASEVAKSFRHGRSGLVRLGGTPFFTDALIAEMVAGFQNAFPNVRVDQSYGYTTELRAALHADRIDLAICPIDILEEGSGLVFQEVLAGRNVVACRAGHPLLSKSSLGTEDLLESAWIAPPLGSPLFADFKSLLLSLGALEIKVRYSGGSLASTLNYLKATDTLALLPHSVVFAFSWENIAALPVDIPHPERALGILRPARAPRAPATDALAMHIRRSCEELRPAIARHERAIFGDRAIGS